MKRIEVKIDPDSLLLIADVAESESCSIDLDNGISAFIIRVDAYSLAIVMNVDVGQGLSSLDIGDLPCNILPP